VSTTSSQPFPRPREGTPLYVHLPFCAAKCHYCDFFSVPAEGHDRGAMIEAILREADHWAPRSPRTLFLGGGTPSLLSAEELKRLLDGLDERTGWRSSALERTAECNPESLDEAKAAALVELGITRLSIGFQSLDPDTLRLFGRVHEVETSFAAFDAARRAGVRALNVDLIYAVPNQRLEDWLRDLERVLALQPEHLSAYNLTFEEETLFRKWLEEGRLERLPEERELSFFQATRERLSQARLDAYEISNFSLNGYQCQHNLNYWHNGEYAGLGPSAVSKVGQQRRGNHKGIQGYTRRMEEQAQACAWSEEPSSRARLAETWWLGLRLSEGLSAREARERAGHAGPDEDFARLALQLQQQGLLELGGEERWRLSAAGLPLADYVARQFLALSQRVGSCPS
jgi:oxygen-independent coproporphyrinogen-3 oxidase